MNRTERPSRTQARPARATGQVFLKRPEPPPKRHRSGFLFFVMLLIGIWVLISFLKSHLRLECCMQDWMLIAGVVAVVLLVIPVTIASFLRDVDAGTIRLVSWLTGGSVIYRGPGKSKEVPLFTKGTTISSKVINV